MRIVGLSVTRFIPTSMAFHDAGVYVSVTPCRKDHLYQYYGEVKDERETENIVAA